MIRTALCLLSIPVPSAAQTPASLSAPAVPPDEGRAIARASAIGAALAAFDRGAWLATDPPKPRMTAAQLASIRGWVV